MSTATITLPLRLYRGHSAADVRSQIAHEIGQLTQRVTERPDRVTDYANNIERLRGQADVLVYLEDLFKDLVEYGGQQGWHMTEVLLAQYDIVANLAVQHPDDTGGSRLNDGKRAYSDGRREVLAWVTRELSRSDYFPGNNNKKAGN